MSAYQLFNYQRYDRATQQALLVLGIESLKPILSLVLAGLLLFSCVHPHWTTMAAVWLAWAFFASAMGFVYCYYWKQKLAQEKILSLKQLAYAEYGGCAYGIVVAILWGSSSQFMRPDQAFNLMLAMIYFGVCAGAASLSVLGMAHMGMAACVAFFLFIEPLHIIFPQHWLWLVAMIALYHGVILISSWQRHQIVARNLMLVQEQQGLIQAKKNEAARAVKANQDKSAFLAAASHDLRQPVHAIMLLGHALQAKLNQKEEGILVEQIVSAGKALSDQFNSLMELSRLESGHYVVAAQTVSLDEFFKKKQQTQQEVAINAGISLKVRVDYRLRKASIRSDIALLNRIIDNLLDNAFKFSALGGRVLLVAQRRNGRLRIVVMDQGEGIPLAQQQNVFLPHVQLDNPTRDRSRGIGLGLSIVKEAAALLSADLKLISQHGKGSSFWLTLPAENLQLDAGPVIVRRMPPQRHDEMRARLKGRHLLIVEDDLMVASALKAWAVSWGISVSHQVQPEKVILQNVDWVICDIRLPSEQDGIYWLSKWLAEWPEMGGVLVSGEAGELIQERAEQEGLLLLAKPVEPELLLQTLLSLQRGF